MVIIYLSSGITSRESSELEKRATLSVVREENRHLNNSVMILTYALMNVSLPLPFSPSEGVTGLKELAFLRDLAEQNSVKYGINRAFERERSSPGSVGAPTMPVVKGSMMVLNQLSNLETSVGRFYINLPNRMIDLVRFSLPYADPMGDGFIMTVSRPCYFGNLLLGVVGVDVNLAYILEDVTYYQDSLASYTLPLGSQVIAVPVNSSLSWHTNRLRDNSKDAYNVSYAWKLVQDTSFILCIVYVQPEIPVKQLKNLNTAPSSKLLYHRLDLLGQPSSCLHFKQLATVGTSMLWLTLASSPSPAPIWMLAAPVTSSQMAPGYAVAVMGIDFTLRYFYKVLLDLLPICNQDKGHKIRCFIMEDRGYLVAHPTLIDPKGHAPAEQQHITHKVKGSEIRTEPLVANDILNHPNFVKKNLCNSFSDRTVQRFYKFNTSIV
ncbi:hypothetical protein GOODEAATRI_008441, partial [Goodea atripinnis]